MKTIGIKLADGSFYPVLQENTVAEKKLELTTAHNNQTKVMVDLYRSALCSMEDGEYVDSLQIDNLVEHPNGEPNIKFTVSLDENNELSAKIVDSETGNQSKTTITLVSRTQEERLITDEYDITDSKEEKSMDEKVSKVAAGGGLLAAAAALRAKEAENDTTEVEFTPAGDMNFDTQEETFETPEVTEEDQTVVFEETSVEPEQEQAEQETAEPEPDSFQEDSIVQPESDIFQEPVLEQTEDDVFQDEIPEQTEPDIFQEVSPDQTEPAESIQINDELSLDLPEDPVVFSDENVEIPEETDISETEIETYSETEENTDSDLSDINFDFPGDDSDQISANETIEDKLDLPDFPSDTTQQMEDDPFALPDDPVDDTTEFEPDIQDDSFDIPDTTEEPEMPDNFFDMDDEPAPASSTYEAPASGRISFTGLYDKETELGESSASEDEDIKKKTKVPVIICVVCAVICLIATAFVLLVIPSKFNLLNKKTDKQDAVIEQPAETPAPVIQEEEPEPVPAAKEDEVVIIEKAEEVVPEQPPVGEEKPADITYKIKWGDTLWDIADTYYKNPWRYKYIARYNNIKNPDHIISGTYITIPAQ